MPQSWREVFQSVTQDLDSCELQSRIFEIESAIFNRIQELSGTPDSSAERREIGEALRMLRCLQVEKLHYPDINTDGYPRNA
jgi:hypothetical protein